MKNHLTALLLLTIFSSFAQKGIKASSLTEEAVAVIHPKKITAIIMHDGQVIMDQKIRIYTESQLTTSDRAINLSDVRIIEVSETKVGHVLAAPFKWIGGAIAVVGVAILGVTTIELEEEGDIELFVAGGVLAVAGVGLNRFGKLLEPAEKNATRAYRTDEWAFSIE